MQCREEKAIIGYDDDAEAEIKKINNEIEALHKVGTGEAVGATLIKGLNSFLYDTTTAFTKGALSGYHKAIGEPAQKLGAKIASLITGVPEVANYDPAQLLLGQLKKEGDTAQQTIEKAQETRGKGYDIYSTIADER